MCPLPSSCSLPIPSILLACSRGRGRGRSRSRSSSSSSRSWREGPERPPNPVVCSPTTRHAMRGATMRSWLIPFPPHAGATQARTAFHCRRGLAEARCGMRACPLQDQIHALNNSCCAVSSSTSPLARERNPAVGWQPCQRRACLWMEMEMKTKMEMGIKMGISCLPSPGAGAPSLSCLVLVASEVWTASFRCGDRLRELAPCTRSWALPDPAGPWPHRQITAFYSEQQTPLWDGHREPNLLPPPILTSPLRPIIAKCARSGGGSDDAWRATTTTTTYSK
jgi:hypothetical protein